LNRPKTQQHGKVHGNKCRDYIRQLKIPRYVL